MMMDESRSQRDAASFRDPSGYVFRRDGRIFRAIDRDCHRILGELIDGGVLGRLIEQRLLVGTRPVDDPELLSTLRHEHPGYEHFVEHDLIEPITYPYEWSASMLADAALLTLDLQERLLEAGHSLKDATPYNVQFMGGRPVFIDVSSIERPARLDVWIALGQFGQMFTFPLLLHRHHGWDLRSYFVGSLGGRDLEQVSRSLGRLGRWRPRNLLDVTLPLLFHRRASRMTNDGRSRLERENPDPRAQLMNLRRLRTKVRALAHGYRPRSTWSDYTSTCSYADQSEAAKKAAVERYLRSIGPATVLDIGCNTGDYSRIAARCGARVVAADADHDAVELLHRRLRNESAAITPMVLDLSSPSPAIGYLNRERPSFLDRVGADCVLALALIHHLHVSGNLPLPAIRDLFAALTRRHVILEFVPPHDPMFRRLMTFRSTRHDDFTIEACRDAFATAFEVVDEQPIPDSPRTLMLLTKKA
ncbi:class I SAM-dependent methyltransferase [Tautonia plasticadhaerens]|uniref:Methyltransferase domain protein n=1 Tax=Tautonia plasticadhaerens TaxID=2527974 RepID=A0A518GVA4_9BACT|nr:class I SAM-dependent methyltransferase [Tautonia plasticadhaerens]QDV32513.1 Methyltransferase domain protein [Tautonia plasticadhaerens]